MAKSDSSSFYGWVNVGLLFGVYGISLGVVFYGFSAIFPVMVAALDWDRGGASMAHTVTVLVMGMSVPLVAMFINRYGAKFTLSLGFGVLIVMLGLLGTVLDSIWQWTLLWGVFGGFAFAFAGMLPVQTTVMHWFSISRATALGVTTTGAAVGGIIALPLYTWVIEISGSWKSGWLMGMAFALLGLLLTFFLVNKPSDINQAVDGVATDRDSDASTAGRAARTYRSTDSWRLYDALRSPSLYVITLAMVCYLAPVVLINTHGVLHLTDIGFSQMDAVSVLGAVLLGSALSRIPAGWMGDRIEPRFILLGAFLLQLVSFFGLWQPADQDMALLSAVFFGLSVGAQMALFPTIVGNYYGAESFTTINGAVGPVLILFVALVPVSGGYLFERFGNYDVAFMAMGAVHLVGAVLALAMLPPRLKLATPVPVQ